MLVLRNGFFASFNERQEKIRTWEFTTAKKSSNFNIQSYILLDNIFLVKKHLLHIWLVCNCKFDFRIELIITIISSVFILWLSIKTLEIIVKYFFPPI